jgi:hypothetical protein
MSESFPTGRASALDLFRPSTEALAPPSLSEEMARVRLLELSGAIKHGEHRNICRWCLEKFDPGMAKPRTTWERGQLRTKLKMADDGSELVICDRCWDAVFYQHFTMGGSPQHHEPEIVPNLLLRETLKP